jgi:multiple sugar transport system permease protein
MNAADGFRRNYWPFVLPALFAVSAVIIFPWMFTLFMSVNDWNVSGAVTFVGLDNYRQLFTDRRFLESIGHTLYFTVLAVALPIVIGTAAALVFHREFRFRGFLRGLFILPMMATPVAVALVWTMMFHPQLGVLNYLLSLVGLLGLSPVHGDPDAGHRRGLALDAAGHADRARRPRQPAGRAL